MNAPHPGADLDWVRDVVLPPAYRRNTVTTCACHYGICGACARGDHTHCLQRHLAAAGRLRPSPLTHLCDAQGRVIGPELWPATGRPCRYRCPCHCPQELHPGLPPPQRPPRRTGGNTAALQEATPKRLRAPEQDTLPGLENAT